MRIEDITGIHQSYVPNLLKYRTDNNKFIIAYKPYGRELPVKIYNRKFAETLVSILSDIEYSIKNGIIIGVVRKRFPNEWKTSDTIERSPTDVNSIHRGLIRTIEEDCIPVFDSATKAMLDLVAIAKNFYADQKRAEKTLIKYYGLQNLILSEILKGNPYRHQ